MPHPPLLLSWKTKQTPWLFSRVVERFFLHSKVPGRFPAGASTTFAFCAVVARTVLVSSFCESQWFHLCFAHWTESELHPTHRTAAWVSFGEPLLHSHTSAATKRSHAEPVPCYRRSRSNLDFDQKKLGFDKKLDQPRFKPLWYGSIALAKLYLLMYCWAQRRRCLATKDRWKGRKPFRGDKRVRMWTLTHVLP